MRTLISAKKLNGLVITPANAVLANENSERIALSLNASIMQLGFIMSESLLNAVKSLSEEDAIELYNDLISVLKNLKGADVKYKPLYPNFPGQVMDMDQSELYLNALAHYWSLGTWRPEDLELTREFAYEQTEFITLDLKTEEDFNRVFTRLVGSNASISDEDKAIIEWFIDKHDTQNYPEEIPFKENLCLIVGKLLQKGEDITDCIKTSTDVLRVITYLSGGDISLANNTKFVSLPRSARKKVIQTLERVINEDDVNRHKNKWGKLFHNLHVGEYKTKAPKVFEIAQKIRENKNLETFNSKLEAALEAKDAETILNLLKKRPGDFARRLDHILRLHTRSRTKTVETFLSVADRVSTRVLMQLLGHFNARKGSAAIEKRVVFPKGNAGKARIIRDELPAFGEGTVRKLTKGIEDVLISKFSTGESLGKVYIDKALKECPIPMQQRSASSGLFTVAKGTRLPISNKETLRLFIYWVGRDIDLSAALYDENLDFKTQVSYTQLKDAKYQACHSGDITSAPRGAAEFIDITIDKAVEFGARYLVMNVFVYSGPNFNEHSACYAGWMTRNEPNKNDKFDAKTVEQKIDLTAASRYAIPVVFDLAERKGIWCDLITKSTGNLGGNNLESNRATTKDLLEAIISLHNKPTLHQLFKLHAKARGAKIVKSKKDADVVFTIKPDGDKTITPYDIDLINSEYLA